MAYTLANLTFAISQRLGQVYNGVATGGSTTTIVDTVGLARFRDDFFNDGGPGTAWIRYVDGAATLPEGDFARITDFDNSSATATVETLGGTVAAGHRYALANSRYPLDDIIEAVNKTLRERRMWVLTTDTSITTAAAQTEYNLPAKIQDLREVWIQDITTDSDNNLWRKIEIPWSIEKTASDTVDKLIFAWQPPTSFSLKLVYRTPNAYIQAYDDAIDDLIDFQLLAAMCALALVKHRQMHTKENDPKLERQLKSLMDEIEELGSSLPQLVGRKQPRLLIRKPAMVRDDFPPIPTS